MPRPLAKSLFKLNLVFSAINSVLVLRAVLITYCLVACIPGLDMEPMIDGKLRSQTNNPILTICFIFGVPFHTPQVD